jgi:Kef-type K+ transport system membrane component KefB
LNGNSLIEKLLNALSITGEGMRVASGIVISLGAILILGFLMTRLTKLLKLPNVIAYLLVGIIIGPSLINLIPGEFIKNSSFISDVALVFVAFTAGEFFKFNVIKKSLGKAIAITALESIATFALVFALCFLVFRLEAPFSLVLASLASATAPTSTIMTIKQTSSKGHYVTTLLEVLAIDGVIALVLYTISISIFVGVADGSALGFADIAWPLLKMFICLAIGVIFGFALKFLISSKRTTGNRLIIVVAVLLLFCGVCSLFGQSPLLGGIAIGMIYTNMCKSQD